MNSTFYTSLAGMKTYQSGIDVWAHNLSNSNLAGFKAKRPEFSTLFTSSLNSASAGDVSSEKGFGSKMNVAAMTKTQGSLTTTESTFDLAINGNGWFGVKNADDITMYTRNGNFNFDSERFLVDQGGGYLTGRMAGNISISPDATDNKLMGVVTDLDLGDPTTQTKLQLPNMLEYPKRYTDTVSISGNLGVGEEEKTFSASLISANNNQENSLKIILKKSANQPDIGSSWEFVATITNPDGSVTFDKKSGVLEFDGEGKIISPKVPTLSNDGLPITLDFGDGAVGLQANDSSAETISVAKNGEPAGQLSNYSVSQDGNVIAFFDNGYKTVVAKVAIYHFQNEQGLQNVGGSYYDANNISGEAMFYRDDQGKLITTEGLVFDHHLEEGNVDNAEALSELMVIQRAYDASSRALKAGDDMIKQALQMDA
jgi:flagellar hook protein FlgE